MSVSQTTPSTEIQENPFSKPWENSDAILMVEECKLHVHSLLLSLASPVFKVLFQSDFTESKIREINLPGKQKDELIKLLKILYPQFTDSAEQEEITIQRVLLALAEEYLMESLKKKIIDNCYTMVNDAKKDAIGRNTELVINALVIAEDQRIQELTDECMGCIINYNYKSIIKCNIYDELSVKTKWTIAKSKVEREKSDYGRRIITDHIDSVLDKYIS